MRRTRFYGTTGQKGLRTPEYSEYTENEPTPQREPGKLARSVSQFRTGSKILRNPSNGRYESANTQIHWTERGNPGFVGDLHFWASGTAGPQEFQDVARDY